MEKLYKYPRTRHIQGSRLQSDDLDLKCENIDFLKDKFLVLEEKVDGANTGISFDENGNMFLQSRGHYLNGGYNEKQFDLFKLWANCFKSRLFELLGSRFILYGEWLYAKHTVFYDVLTHYFMEFDIYDKKENLFLSTKRRKEFLSSYDFIVSVFILYQGNIKTLDELTSYIGVSNFKTKNCFTVFQKQCEKLNLNYEKSRDETDGTNLMEGIYIKVENDYEVLDRFKYVRSSFLNTILDSQTHWADRTIIPNILKPDIDLFYYGMR